MPKSSQIFKDNNCWGTYNNDFVLHDLKYIYMYKYPNIYFYKCQFPLYICCMKASMDVAHVVHDYL